MNNIKIIFFYVIMVWVIRGKSSLLLLCNPTPINTYKTEVK